MKLQGRLVTGFAIVLLLMAVITFMGWRGTETMSRQTELITKAEAEVTHMLTAQVRQYQFMMSKDEARYKQALDAIDHALADARDVDQLAQDPANKSLNREGLAFLEKYRGDIARLVDTIKRRQVLDDDLTVVSTTLYTNVNKLRDTLRTYCLEGNDPRFFRAFDASATAVSAFDAMRIQAWTFDLASTQATLDALNKAAADALKALAITRENLRVAENIALHDAVKAGVEEYQRRFANYARMSFEIMDLDKGIGAALEKALDTMTKVVDRADQSALQAKGTSNTLAFAVAGISILLGLGIAFTLTRSVLRQLGKDPGDLARIAHRVVDGEFNIDDGSPRHGVYGNIVSMVDAMRDHIDRAKAESERAQEESARARRATQDAEKASAEATAKSRRMSDAAEKLEQVSSVLSSSSTQLAAQIEQSERGSAEQAERVTETATAMEEMNSTVLEVARNAGSASEVSAQTRSKAVAGSDVVQHAVHSILQVRQQSVQLREDMGNLDRSAQAISEILGVISDIADQTNLLALNAAIEAARAGDAGRGFAVVADEVRKLAEKTMESTARVGRAIGDIQQAATRSMQQVDSSVSAIEDATQYAEQSGTALEEIVEMVDSAADQVRAIATASEQQSATSEEINHAIGEVNNIAAETARTMQEAAKAVTHLADQAKVLSALITDMRRG